LVAQARTGLERLRRELLGLQGLSTEVSARLAFTEASTPATSSSLPSLSPRQPTVVKGFQVTDPSRRLTSPVGVRHRRPGPPASRRELAERTLQELDQAAKRCRLAVDRTSALLADCQGQEVCVEGLTGSLRGSPPRRCAWPGEPAPRRPLHEAECSRGAIFCGQLQDCVEANRALCHECCALGARVLRGAGEEPAAAAQGLWPPDDASCSSERLTAASWAPPALEEAESVFAASSGASTAADFASYAVPLTSARSADAAVPARDHLHAAMQSLVVVTAPPVSARAKIRTTSPVLYSPPYSPPDPLAAGGQRCLAAELGRPCRRQPCQRCDCPGGWRRPDPPAATVAAVPVLATKEPPDAAAELACSGRPRVASRRAASHAGA